MKIKKTSNQKVSAKFAVRNVGKAVRTNKKITGYAFKILVADSNPLTGLLSRSEMELIHRLYTSEGANLQLRTIAREFTQYTLEDLKKILKTFKITKAACVLAPHLLEEMTPDEASDYALRIKEKTFIKRLEENRVRHNETKVKELMTEVQTLKAELNSSDAIFKNLDLSNLPAFQSATPLPDNGKDLIIYLSDMHIGAAVNEEGVYSNPYDKAEVMARLQKVYDTIQEHGFLRNLTIFNLGDALDGYDQKTTRTASTHILPQNMTNREQARTYIEIMTAFFNQLITTIPLKALNFVSVGESNHGGDFEYTATLALQAILRQQGVNVVLADRPVSHIKIADITYIYLHGKDNTNQFKNFPLYVDQRVENYFNEYIMRNGLSGKIVVVKGDLHQSATSPSKFFTYKSVGSLFGASNWIHSNFGKTEWGCDYSVIENGKRLDGVVTQ